MKLKILFILCLFIFSCTTNKKTQETPTEKTISNYAPLIVTKIEDGKDGYTATLKNNNGNIYTCDISIPNLENEYKSLKVGDKVKIIGDYGNGEPTPIIVKQIIILK